MTNIELKFMEMVPDMLRGINKSLESIDKKMTAAQPVKDIWVLFSESLYEFELMGRHIAVYTDEGEARKAFAEIVKVSRQTAYENDWEIGEDDENSFEAYPDGRWGTSHETVTLSKTVLNTKP